MKIFEQKFMVFKSPQTVKNLPKPSEHVRFRKRTKSFRTKYLRFSTEENSSRSIQTVLLYTVYFTSSLQPCVEFRDFLSSPFNPYTWIFGTVTERNFWKKIPEKSPKKLIVMVQRARWRSRVLDFFQNSWIRVQAQEIDKCMGLTRMCIVESTESMTVNLFIATSKTGS